MTQQKELITLKKGEPVDHYLLLKKCDLRLTKANKEYLAVELGDKSCSLNSNIWDNFESIYNSVKTGDVVKVTGTIEEFQGTSQIKVTRIRKTSDKDGVSPIDFQARSKRSPEIMRKEFFDRI
jgi:3'-5' exoribonuclease